ncbi:hypothetical protein PTSG_05762 [Salpingoeca rosetta]|uniref:N-acetyltransferase domain-containing protein n=1 Tax=Salpingoeca rosetta (strain ATCC 50818 / BSB-021) TaxID=946362 RepID=F2UB57_SALR5|nr:uncharacterized protein PTSG_05762 [Salpingoeca rosetta]EGD74070.1 hypothetical protein PTSG_05762 [Salpingoeca rosetta]|eukprot:XP_004993632.1 hypothetical protein PTSG_05762 [Salpingoeca rosetta]
MSSAWHKSYNVIFSVCAKSTCVHDVMSVVGKARTELAAQLEAELRQLPPKATALSCPHATPIEQGDDVESEDHHKQLRACLPCILTDYPLATKMVYLLRYDDDSVRTSAHDAASGTYISAVPPNKDLMRPCMLTFYRPADETMAPALAEHEEEEEEQQQQQQQQEQEQLEAQQQEQQQQQQGQQAPGGEQMLSQQPVHTQSSPLFTVEHFHLDQPNLVTALPRGYVPALQRLAQQHSLECAPGAQCHLWLHPPHTAFGTPRKAAAVAGSGKYTLGRLRQEHADLINRRWTYGGTPASLRFIQHLIDTFHTAAAFAADGTPVCWALQQPYGAIGMVHTEPEHRRQGLASAVALMLAEQIEAGGQLAYAYITDENASSQAMFTALGFRQTSATDWWHVRPT